MRPVLVTSLWHILMRKLPRARPSALHASAAMTSGGTALLAGWSSPDTAAPATRSSRPARPAARHCSASAVHACSQRTNCDRRMTEPHSTRMNMLNLCSVQAARQRAASMWRTASDPGSTGLRREPSNTHSSVRCARARCMGPSAATCVAGGMGGRCHCRFLPGAGTGCEPRG